MTVIDSKIWHFVEWHHWPLFLSICLTISPAADSFLMTLWSPVLLPLFRWWQCPNSCLLASLFSVSAYLPYFYCPCLHLAWYHPYRLNPYPSIVKCLSFFLSSFQIIFPELWPLNWDFPCSYCRLGCWTWGSAHFVDCGKAKRYAHFATVSVGHYATPVWKSSSLRLIWALFRTTAGRFNWFFCCFWGLSSLEKQYYWSVQPALPYVST